MRLKAATAKGGQMPKDRSELSQIHEAIMNPMDVKIAGDETFTVRRVKEFIQQATNAAPQVPPVTGDGAIDAGSGNGADRKSDLPHPGADAASAPGLKRVQAHLAGEVVKAAEELRLFLQAGRIDGDLYTRMENLKEQIGWLKGFMYHGGFACKGDGK